MQHKVPTQSFLTCFLPASVWVNRQCSCLYSLFNSLGPGWERTQPSSSAALHDEATLALIHARLCLLAPHCAVSPDCTCVAFWADNASHPSSSSSGAGTGGDASSSAAAYISNPSSNSSPAGSLHWSQLPDDIKTSILSHLPLRELARIAHACR
jgi:hypothetical protein